MKKFELSELPRKLVGLLRYLDKGVEITYTDLSRQIGESVNAKNSIYPRYILQRDHAIVFVCIKNVGLKRLTDLEIAERLPAFWLAGARNKLTRGGAQADVVDISKLDKDQTVAFSVSSVQRELAAEALSRATKRKMEKVARGSSNDLPSFTIAEWAISLSPKVNSRI